MGCRVVKVYRQKPWIITTGKGQAYIVLAHSHDWAATRFQTEFPGVVIASILEAEAVL